MEGQIEPQNQEPHNASRVLAILVTFIVTALVIGGAVYYWQQTVLDQKLNEVNAQIRAELNQEILVLKQQLEDSVEKVGEVDQVAIIGLDWQKYTNSDYGFSLRTPLNWAVDYGKLDIDGLDGNKVYISGTSNSIRGQQAHIVVTPLIGDETELEAFSRLQDLDASLLTSKAIELGNLQVTAYHDPSNKENISVITFIRDGNLYAAYDLKPEDRDSSSNIFLAIVGSIKLEDASRQTYSDENFNYSFSYPEDWNIDGNLLSYTEIKKYEIGSNNAPISFGAYSSDANVLSKNTKVLNFNKKQYYIDNAEKNEPDSVVLINGHQFYKYDLIDPGTYEGDSAGNVVILVSQDSISDTEDIKLVFTWEEFPGSTKLADNSKSDFMDVVSSIEIK